MLISEREDFDESLLQRLNFTVHFPLPDVQMREQLWAKLLPFRKAPIKEDVDINQLAQQFPFSGGSIMVTTVVE